LPKGSPPCEAAGVQELVLHVADLPGVEQLTRFAETFIG
jgi:hypothetical protein